MIFRTFLWLRNGYNLREHSSFNYRSPVEIWNSSGVSLSVTAGGLWTWTVTICCEDNQKVESDNTVYQKKHVSQGDYRQRKGKRSEIIIPTGKLFGLRKFDLVKTVKGIGIVKGKRSRGTFNVSDIFGNNAYDVNIKKFCKRLLARTTTLIQLQRGDVATFLR